MERKKSIIPVIVILSGNSFRFILGNLFLHHKTVFIDTPYKVFDSRMGWRIGLEQGKEYSKNTRLFGVHPVSRSRYLLL